MGNTFWSATAEVSQVPAAPTDEALGKLRQALPATFTSYTPGTGTLVLEWSFPLLSTTVREAAKNAEWSVRKGLEHAGVEGRITSVQVRERVEGDTQVVAVDLMSLDEAAAFLQEPSERVLGLVRPVAWVEGRALFLGEAVHRVLLGL